jgi:hypothetical protein
MSTNFGHIIVNSPNATLGNIDNSVGKRTCVPDCCTSKSWSWIYKIILAIGVALLIAGSITLANNLLPFGASVTFISVGSILTIAGLFKHALPWIKDKFETPGHEIHNGSGLTIVNGRIITP